MKKLIIVGAGISGISLARMLIDRLDVLILEKTAGPGGLMRCDTFDGMLFHKVGGHVFNSKNKDVLEWFWKQFDAEREFFRVRRKARILLEGRYVGYPLENHLYQLDQKTISDALHDLLALNAGAKKEPTDFESFLRTRFGATLYNLYFGPYNSKVWNADLAGIPLGWLADKLPMPNLQRIIMSNIEQQEETEMVHSTFFYPKKDGSQYIINRLAEGLNIQCNTDVATIESSGDRLVINGDLEADYLVYTGDVRQLARMYRIADPLARTQMERISGLRANGTSNVLCQADSTDLTWLYLPSAAVKANRIIYTGNLSSFNNGAPRFLTCVVEFPGRQEEEFIREEIVKLPGNLRPIAFNYEPNSYVIQGYRTRDDIRQLQGALAKRNVYLLGRFAEWEYYNMDKCMESAMNVKGILMAAAK